MVTLTLQVPDSLLLTAEGSIARLTQQSQFLLALKFFEIGQLSSGQAAAMCRMNRVDFLLEAGRHGIAVAELSDDELDREVRHANQN